MANPRKKLHRIGGAARTLTPAPSIPLGPVQTVVHVKWGKTPAGPMVALELVTPLGSHTYLFEPVPAGSVADELRRMATLCQVTDGPAPDAL